MINLTIVRTTVRALFGRSRFLLLLPLPVLVVGLAGLMRVFDVATTEWAIPILVGLGVSLVLPLLSLIVGASVLGSEIDDGTVVHLLTKPLPRREIVLSKLVAAAGVTVLVMAVALGVAAWFTGEAALAGGLAVGAVLGGLVYSALFVALSLVSRRPVLIGLLYVLIWEGLLANLLPGAGVLSVQHYVLAVATGISDTDLLSVNLSMPVALVMSALVVVAATGLAINRLQVFRLTGETG